MIQICSAVIIIIITVFIVITLDIKNDVDLDRDNILNELEDTKEELQSCEELLMEDLDRIGKEIANRKPASYEEFKKELGLK